MTSMFLVKVVPLLSLFVSGAWAQFDMAQCKTGFEWNRNSLNQDPCTVGSMLDASCRGLVLYNYPPLNASQYYLPPRTDHSGDLDCDCNTVMYNLYTACASCQGGQIYEWTKWTPACDNVYISQYPHDIPQGTAVPHWVFFNVTSAVNQTYDQATMISIGRNPEESPTPITTVSGGSSATGKTTLTPSGTTTSSQSGSTSSNTPKGGTNVGAIVGGVVGSVVPLTILGAVIFFYTRRRRQQPPHEQMQNPDGFDPYKQQHPPSMYGPPATSAPFTPYNPSDPSTFPPQSPPNSVTYTTPAYNPNARGAYSGAPEV